MTKIKLAIIGMGKIARDQHVPSIRNNDHYQLIGVASPHSRLDGITNFKDIGSLLEANPDVDAVSICTPPQVRFDVTAIALRARKHVMLEKPPGMTVSEVMALTELARQANVSLFTTWHSREAAAVESARQWLSTRNVQRVIINWKEDVRVWHPGQDWIWNAGGLGVFDPGINALSIITRILPFAVRLQSAELQIPANRATPIAATLQMESRGAAIHAEFDFRQTGPQSWDIDVHTDQGVLKLTHGGSRMLVNDVPVITAQDQEYPNLYAHFAQLVRENRIDVDVAPLQLVADAMLCGKQLRVAAFEW
jgi:D-galactose 1-dehydrogenase